MATPPLKDVGKANYTIIENADFRRQITGLKDENGDPIDLSTATLKASIYTIDTDKTKTFVADISITAVSPAATSGAVDLFLDDANQAAVIALLPDTVKENNTGPYKVALWELRISELVGDTYVYIQGDISIRLTQTTKP